MRLLCKTSNKNELAVRYIPFGSAICGTRILSVTLDALDFRQIREALDGDSEVRKENCIQRLIHLSCKFPPLQSRLHIEDETCHPDLSKAGYEHLKLPKE